jgi:NitT/TauT family transport system substrate-binding protein
LFAGQKASIAPLRAKVGAAETNPLDQEALLRRDIKFFFQPNSSKLDMNKTDNTKNLESIVQLLKVSPGSVVLLRGHADGSQLDRFRSDGGEARVREAKLVLKNLSKARCGELKQILQDRYTVDGSRVEAQGVGADEPTGKGPDADRRVEVQWFTME